MQQRLGGIYALEGVMKKEYYQPVLEALCAFVRDNTAVTRDEPPASDIRAALTVIGRRNAGDNRGEAMPDLRGVQLQKADLKDADLSGTNLTKANLTSANLTKANLTSADLSGATLLSATLNGAYLSGAHLSGADLKFADL